MWLCFLQHFGGCLPISVPSSPVVEIYMDASANPNLGWGVWSGKQWMWNGWEPQFLASFQPSNDFLEMYAIVVAIYTWTPNLINKTVHIFSDNSSAVDVLKDLYSQSTQLMHLVRFLTLHCMLNNITLTPKFLPGELNQVSDALSNFQFDRFWHLHPEADKESTPSHPFLSPLTEHTFNNLLI